MRSKLGHAATRLVTLVRGLGLPSDPGSADPHEIQRLLTEQAGELRTLQCGSLRDDSPGRALRWPEAGTASEGPAA